MTGAPSPSDELRRPIPAADKLAEIEERLDRSIHELQQAGLQYEQFFQGEGLPLSSSDRYQRENDEMMFGNSAGELVGKFYEVAGEVELFPDKVLDALTPIVLKFVRDVGNCELRASSIMHGMFVDSIEAADEKALPWFKKMLDPSRISGDPLEALSEEFKIRYVLRIIGDNKESNSDLFHSPALAEQVMPFLKLDTNPRAAGKWETVFLASEALNAIGIASIPGLISIMGDEVGRKNAADAFHEMLIQGKKDHRNPFDVFKAELKSRYSGSDESFNEIIENSRPKDHGGGNWMNTYFDNLVVAMPEVFR